MWAWRLLTPSQSVSGLCISGTVYDHVVAKLPLDYSAIGMWMGQGTPTPVRVYRVQIEPTARPPLWRVSAPRTRLVWPRGADPRV